MRKFITFIAILCLIAGVGCLVYAGANGQLSDISNWGTNQLSTKDRVTSSAQIGENDFEQVNIDINTLDCAVIFEYKDLSATGEYYIINMPDAAGMFFQSDVWTDGSAGKTISTVTLTQNIKYYLGGRAWFSFGGIRENYVKVTLDNSIKNKVSVNISSDVGYATIEGDFKEVNIDIDTGAVDITNVKATSVRLHSDTGAVNVKYVVCDSLNISSNTGAVSINYLTCPVVVLSSDTGAVNVKNLSSCDTLDIDVDTGAITVGILGNKADYNISVRKGTGSTNISDQTVAGSIKSIKVRCDTGAINFKFS